MPPLRPLPRLAALLLAGAAFVASAGVAPAQRPADDAPRRAPVLRLAQVADGAIVADGRLDEAAWATAPVAADFVQREPFAGRPSRYRTEVRVLLSPTAIHVGVHAFDPAPDSIGRQLARRDVDDIYADRITIAFDSFRDRRTAFAFELTPRGVQRDAYLFDDTEDDPLWDAVWQSGARIVDDGWIAEFRIPLSQLRFSRTATTGAGDLPPGSWGFNVRRLVARDGETSFWADTPPTQPGVVSRFGTLAGLEELGRPSTIELLPYLRTQATARPADARSALVGAGSGEVAAGVDVRWRLPRNLTLSGTVNPDFGQAEVDPAVVNLTQFEVFFPERRPFFLEGVDAFAFGRTRTFNDDDPPTFFYSRRIGRAPARRPAGAGIVAVDAPTGTAILGAAKVSGKTPGGWSVGALAAATREERARLLGADGAVTRTPVEPTGGYGILRLRRDARAGNTVVGGIATIAARDAGGAFASLLPSRSAVAGLDFEHAWAGRTWVVSGVLAASDVAGDTAYVRRLQQAPYRLYQRPDAAHLAVDPARTALGGHFAALSLARTAGRVVGSLTYEETSPGFEVNDLGFQQRADFRSLSTELSRRTLVQGSEGLARAFRSWEVGTFGTVSTNFAGDLLALRTAAFAEAVFANFWEAEVFVTRSARAWADRLTRGGPLARIPERVSVSGELSTDSRRPVIVAAAAGWTRDPAGRRAHDVSLAVDLRPTSALRLRLTPAWTVRRDPDQYLATVDDPAATATFGRRHIFAIIDRQELNLTTRVDWTFSPTLSLQLFAQPFAAAGRVTTFRSFDRPRAFDFTTLPAVRGDGTVALDAGGAAPIVLDEPDFRLRSLRGNAVLRWEFRPGSALFLVWQQQRSIARDPALGPLASPGIGGDAFRTLGDPGTHVFLAKITWWIGR